MHQIAYVPILLDTANPRALIGISYSLDLTVFLR